MLYWVNIWWLILEAQQHLNILISISFCLSVGLPFLSSLSHPSLHLSLLLSFSLPPLLSKSQNLISDLLFSRWILCRYCRLSHGCVFVALWMCSRVSCAKDTMSGSGHRKWRWSAACRAACSRPNCLITNAFQLLTSFFIFKNYLQYLSVCDCSYSLLIKIAFSFHITVFWKFCVLSWKSNSSRSHRRY